MKPQDIVILLKIATMKGSPFLQKDIADGLHISKSELSESLNRSVLAGLLRSDKKQVLYLGLTDFIKSGLRYVFPAAPDRIVRGIATAHSAYPLNEKIVSEKDVYVWPFAKGDKRGQAIEPLYDNAPEIAKSDPELYQLLTLVDAIRVGRAREKSIATEMIEERLKNYASKKQ